MSKLIILLSIIIAICTGVLIKESYHVIPISNDNTEIVKNEESNTGTINPGKPILNPVNDDHIFKFTLQSTSGFCQKTAEGCGESSLTITKDTTIYQNNKRTCPGITQDIDWTKLTAFHIEDIKGVNIPKVCSSCFDAPEMNLSVQTYSGTYQLDFDAVKRFDFDQNNTAHTQLKEITETINTLWKAKTNICASLTKALPVR